MLEIIANWVERNDAPYMSLPKDKIYLGIIAINLVVLAILRNYQ